MNPDVAETHTQENDQSNTDVCITYLHQSHMKTESLAMRETQIIKAHDLAVTFDL